MPVPKLTHIALRVKNPTESAKFYEKYCALKVQHRRVDQEEGEDVEVIWLANHEQLQGFVMVLMQAEPEMAPRGSFHHLGFEVNSREEVDALAALAEQDDILVVEAQDAGDIVGYICAFTDPDDNLVEISYGQVIMPPGA